MTCFRRNLIRCAARGFGLLADAAPLLLLGALLLAVAWLLP